MGTSLSAAPAGALPPKNWSIVAWAAVAASSVLLSYLMTLALGLVFTGFGILLTLAVAQRVSILGVLMVAFLFMVGLTVLWSLIPRKNEFKPEGILIDLSREDGLRSEIAEIARAMKQPVPSEVYLISSVNAGVAQRPRGRKVMLIGLPLLQMLTVSQFRAVLAHEFAHFYAGDTRLGPWVFKARDNMARVVSGLSERTAVVSFLTRFAVIALLHMIVVGGLILYWKLFTRMTQYISRRQEFRCDELACHIAGSENLAQGLCNLERASPMFGTYWKNVVMPVATRGFHPPLADGFGRFLKTPAVERVTTSILDRVLSSGKTGPLDSHPPLNARLQRARALAIPAANDDERSAFTLVTGLPSLELQLLKKVAPEINTAELKPMSWDSAGADVYIPLWRNDTQDFRKFLRKWTVAALPEVLRDLPVLANQVSDPPGILLSTSSVCPVWLQWLVVC